MSNVCLHIGGQMSGYDDDALDLCCYQRVEQSIENRPISDLDEAFGGAIGQRPKASADAGSKNDGGRGHRVEYCPLSRRAPGGNLTSRRRFALVVCASLVVIDNSDRLLAHAQGAALADEPRHVANVVR